MVSVNYFKVFSEFIQNKVNSGSTITTSQFSAAANQAQLVPFTADYETFVKTGVVSQYLQTFLTTNYIFNPTTLNQVIPYPANFQFVSSVGNLINGRQNNADLVDNVKWRDMFVPNSLDVPTLRFPKYQQIGAGLIVAPYNWGTGYLDYFHTPRVPVWGYLDVNNTQQYNPATSVNFEFDDFATNMVLSNYLKFIGINLQSNDIAGFSEQFNKEVTVPL